MPEEGDVAEQINSQKITSMAAASRRVPKPIFRTKSSSLITESSSRRRRLSTAASPASADDIPMLQKLLEAPISRIKTALDSELSHGSAEFPWPSLLSYLNISAPHKTHLVLEWKLEKLIKEDRKNHVDYGQLISLCEIIKNLPIALFVFTSMEAQGVKPTSSVFNALISTSLSSGNLLTGLSIFEIMKGSEDYKPDSDTYNAFISAYANLGNKIATEAWATAKKASGFSSDVQTYDSLIRCRIKSKSFEDAQIYFEEMMSAGLMPNESIFHNMLLMYLQLKNLCRVKEILMFLPNGKWRINRNVAKQVVGFYSELGLIEEVERLIVILTESNQAPEILSPVYCCVIRMYADRDRLDDVEYSVGRMLKHGISFDCEEDVEKVICCYFRMEAYDRLDLFLECIKDCYKLTRSIYDLLGAGY